jgi:hypothetical protein
MATRGNRPLAEGTFDTAEISKSGHAGEDAQLRQPYRPVETSTTSKTIPYATGTTEPGIVSVEQGADGNAAFRKDSSIPEKLAHSSALVRLAKPVEFKAIALTNNS